MTFASMFVIKWKMENGKKIADERKMLSFSGIIFLCYASYMYTVDFNPEQSDLKKNEIDGKNQQAIRNSILNFSFRVS